MQVDDGKENASVTLHSALAESISMTYRNPRTGEYVPVPDNWDGTVDTLPGAKEYGYLIDFIILGPTYFSGNQFPIYNFDCIGVKTPIDPICPKADRKPLLSWMPQIEGRFREMQLVQPDEFIHWVGSQSKVEHVCECLAAPKVPEPPLYLGEGRLKIDGQIHIIQATRPLRLLVTLLKHEGVASTEQLQNAGITNPSEAFSRLQNWRNEVLKPYLTAPGRNKKGAGYRTLIRSAK